MTRFILAGCCALLLCPTLGLAQDADTHRDAAVSLHLLERRPTSCSTIELVSCEDAINLGVTGEVFQSYYAVLAVISGNRDAGFGGLSLGIDYDGRSGSGVELSNWTLCADLEFPNGSWPAAGGGNRITWNVSTNCQQTEPDIGAGISAVAGYFYMTAYSEDVFELTENRNLQIPEFAVADCAAGRTQLDPGERAGRISFHNGDGEAGYFPCPEVNYEATTWGNVKKQYGNRR